MREDIHVLDKKEIFEKLRYFNGWRYKKDKIYKEFKFKDFTDAINFIVKLTPFFDKNDHHPDIHIFYNRVLFELQRFDVGGLVTDLDFVVAGEIESSYNNLYNNSIDVNFNIWPLSYEDVEV